MEFDIIEVDVFHSRCGCTMVCVNGDYMIRPCSLLCENYLYAVKMVKANDQTIETII